MVHQRKAMDALREGRDVVLATGTGSGKSLAAWTPILSELVEAEDSSRISAIHRRPTALYLAPTKALAADQLASLMALLGQNDAPTDALGRADPEGGHRLVDERLRRVRATTVDGDTPREAKEWARAGTDLILSNPDFLHYVMSSAHQRWSRFLASLRLIVIDEAHHWRGVTGSHIALVVRRLLRVAHHLGADPRVVMLSATVRDAASVGARADGARRCCDHRGRLTGGCARAGPVAGRDHGRRVRGRHFLVPGSPRRAAGPALGRPASARGHRPRPVHRPRRDHRGRATSALDVSVRAQILNLLTDLKRDLGLAMVFISHDIQTVRYVSDRIAVMNGGKVVEEGPAAQLLADPKDPYTRKLLGAAPSLLHPTLEGEK